jgi:hypothetical protein
MREIPREQRSHAFLIKALREAGGELLSELEGIRQRDALRAPPGEWSFAQIAQHVRDNDEIFLHNVNAIIGRRRSTLLSEPFGVAPEGDEARFIDIERAAYGYAALRQRSIYALYDLDATDWERTGEHPFRGHVTLLQLARELHLHDLEHLWQVRAHKQELAGLVR